MIYLFSFLFIIIFVVIISIPYMIISEKRRKNELEKVFGRRQELSDRDFYENYFESQGIPFYVVKKIRKILEELLYTDLSKLLPEDDFFQNLNFLWQEDYPAFIEIFKEIEEEFEIKFHQSDFENLKTLTVSDIVNLVWEKIQKSNESSN